MWGARFPLEAPTLLSSASSATWRDSGMGQWLCASRRRRRRRRNTDTKGFGPTTETPRAGQEGSGGTTYSLVAEVTAC